MTNDEIQTEPQVSNDKITTKMLKDAGLTPDVLNILFGVAFASVLPQAKLVKTLIAKNVITQNEAAGIYDELLKSSKFPPGVDDLVRPIWTQIAEGIRKGER